MLHLFLNCDHPMLDRINGLTTVIHALKSTDLNTFENAIEYIMCNVDRTKCVNLGESTLPCIIVTLLPIFIVTTDSSLLDVIISTNDFPSHWPLIRKLIERGEKMSRNMAQRFIAHLMKPPISRDLCIEVHQYIEKYKCIDLPAVHLSIKDPFLKLCTRASSEE